ncbi:MAG: hypothetical protein ACTSU5_18310, partial [Promethearchaeota archaeon]
MAFCEPCNQWYQVPYRGDFYCPTCHELLRFPDELSQASGKGEALGTHAVVESGTSGPTGATEPGGSTTPPQGAPTMASASRVVAGGTAAQTGRGGPEERGAAISDEIYKTHVKREEAFQLPKNLWFFKLHFQGAGKYVLFLLLGLNMYLKYLQLGSAYWQTQ